MKLSKFKLIAVTLGIAGLIVVPLVWAAVGTDSTALREAVSADEIYDHLLSFEAIGPRVPGMGGYEAASGYIADLMEAAGYDVTVQPFDFDLWEEFSDPVL